jgi:hypothetical protein
MGKKTSACAARKSRAKAVPDEFSLLDSRGQTVAAGDRVVIPCRVERLKNGDLILVAQHSGGKLVIGVEARYALRVADGCDLDALVDPAKAREAIARLEAFLSEGEE